MHIIFFPKFKTVQEAIVAIVISLFLSITMYGMTLFLDLFVQQTDHFIHYYWSVQFIEALKDGVAIPRWAYLSHFGLGDPTFLYYQPLFYYAMAIAHYFTNDIWLSVRIIIFCSNILLGMVSYFLVRQSATQSTAVLGMAFTQTSPFLLYSNTFVGTLPWMFASPFVLIYLYACSKEKTSILLASVSLAVTVLSHIISGFMIIVCVGCLRVLLLLSKRDKTSLYDFVCWLIASALGLSLAGYYLFPALASQHLITPSAWTEALHLKWQHGFAFPALTLFSSGFRWFVMQIPFPIIGVLPALIALYWHCKAKQNNSIISNTAAFNFAWTAVICAILSSELAYPIYMTFTSMQKLQQPYRFTAPMLLASGLAFSCIDAATTKNNGINKKIRILFIATFFISSALSIGVLFKLGQEGKPTAPAFANIDLSKIDIGAPEYMVATHGGNWKNYIIRGGLESECKRLNMQCLTITSSTHRHEWLVRSIIAQKIVLPLFSFPAWQARIDGVVVTSISDPETGLVSLHIPEGEHKIVVKWDCLPSERIGNKISLFAIFVLFGFFTKNLIKKS